MTEEKKDNLWVAEIKKFIGQEVEVSFLEGTKAVTVTGKLKCMNFMYLNCILIIGEKKRLIKNIFWIDRKRDYVEGK